MARYSYITVVVAVCRDFDEDRHMDVIRHDNPVATLCNLVEHGRAVVEVRAVLGRADLDNYMEPVVIGGKTKYRSCLVVRRFYLRLPRPMTRSEASEYIEDATGIKLPVEPGSEEYCALLTKIYEKLVKR